MSIDLHTLSGVYAIDALSAEEAEEFERHLEQCDGCREEVRELQAAAATMGASEAMAPSPALKARILAAADQLPQVPPRVVPIQAARSHRWTARIGSAAAAVVLVVGTGVGISQWRSSQNEPPVMAASVSQVFRAGDAKTETVNTSNGGKVTVATSEQLGRMALETHSLPTLSNRQVYQLWTVHNGSPTSAGLVDDVAVGMAMALPSDSTVAITIEPTGGSDQPTTKPIVTMDPQSV